MKRESLLGVGGDGDILDAAADDGAAHEGRNQGDGGAVMRCGCGRQSYGHACERDYQPKFAAHALTHPSAMRNCGYSAVSVSRHIFALPEVEVYSAFVPEDRLQSGSWQARSKHMNDKGLDAGASCRGAPQNQNCNESVT